MIVQSSIKQPPALLVLFFSEFAARFSYWGIQSLLVLYLIHHLHLSSTMGYEIFGVFTASTFALSILGGLMADNFFGYKKTLIIGVVVALLGNILLCMPGNTFMFLGLACVNYGIGIFLPNNSNLLGCFYNQNDNRRDRGFTIFYMGTNIGGLLGPVSSGILASYCGIRYAFILNAFLLLLWLILYISTSRWFNNIGNLKKTSTLKPCYQVVTLLLITIVFIFSLFILLNYPENAGNLLGIIGAGTIIFILYTTFTKYRGCLKKIMMLISMALLALIFFACEFQVNSSLLEFINQYVNRQIGFFTLPTQTFAALEPAFVIITAPLIALISKWLQSRDREPSAFFKIIIGIFLSSIAFFIFGYAADLINHTTKEISILWILIGNLILGAAEICIMPPLISSITQLAPPNFKATLMGALYVALAFSGYIAGMLAKMTDKGVHEALSANAYAHTYFSISFGTVFLAIFTTALILTWIYIKGTLARLV